MPPRRFLLPFPSATSSIFSRSGSIVDGILLLLLLCTPFFALSPPPVPNILLALALFAFVLNALATRLAPKAGPSTPSRELALLGIPLAILLYQLWLALEGNELSAHRLSILSAQRIWGSCLTLLCAGMLIHLGKNRLSARSRQHSALGLLTLVVPSIAVILWAVSDLAGGPDSAATGAALPFLFMGSAALLAPRHASRRDWLPLIVQRFVGLMWLALVFVQLGPYSLLAVAPSCLFYVENRLPKWAVFALVSGYFLTIVALCPGVNSLPISLEGPLGSGGLTLLQEQFSWKPHWGWRGILLEGGWPWLVFSIFLLIAVAYLSRSLLDSKDPNSRPILAALLAGAGAILFAPGVGGAQFFLFYGAWFALASASRRFTGRRFFEPALMWGPVDARALLIWPGLIVALLLGARAPVAEYFCSEDPASTMGFACLTSLNAEAYLSRAEYLVAEEDWDKAAALIDMGSRLEPLGKSVWLQMRLAKGRGQHTDALEWGLRGAQLCRGNVQDWRALLALVPPEFDGARRWTLFLSALQCEAIQGLSSALHRLTLGHVIPPGLKLGSKSLMILARDAQSLGDRESLQSWLNLAASEFEEPRDINELIALCADLQQMTLARQLVEKVGDDLSTFSRRKWWLALLSSGECDEAQSVGGGGKVAGADKQLQVQCLVSAERYLEASALMGPLMQDGISLVALRLRSEIARQAGAREDLIQVLEMWAELETSRGEIHLELAALYEGSGRYLRAKRQLLSCVELAEQPAPCEAALAKLSGEN